MPDGDEEDFYSGFAAGEGYDQFDQDNNGEPDEPGESSDETREDSEKGIHHDEEEYYEDMMNWGVE